MHQVKDERDALDLALRVFDLSAKELAQKAGVSTSQISRYRNKARDMKAESIKPNFRYPSDATTGKSLLFGNCCWRATSYQAIVFELMSINKPRNALFRGR